MVTGDRLLTFVSGALLAVFLAFAAVIVVRELTRSRDPLNRIVEEHCASLAAAGTDAPPGATFLPRVPAATNELAGTVRCLFLDATTRDATPFSRAFFAHDAVPGWDYLYLGPRGVLVVRDEEPFAAEASLARDCLRDDRCDAGAQSDRVVSLTFSLVAADGGRPVTVSFYERLFGDVLREARPLLAEMCAAKKKDPAALSLEVAFHRHYALVAGPDEERLNELAKPERDGLFLASRGAKIRLLPWEYRSNPLRAIAAKGVSYGLEKDEYRKEVAAMKIFMVERYREEGGLMRPVAGAPEVPADAR